MKAILIDPFAKEITEVEYSGDFQDIYKLIDCQTFDCVTFNQAGDGVFVDDEGLYDETKEFFKFPGMQPLAGKGLVLGVDPDGESISPSITLSAMKEMTSFMSVAVAQLLISRGIY